MKIESNSKNILVLLSTAPLLMAQFLDKLKTTTNDLLILIVSSHMLTNVVCNATIMTKQSQYCITNIPDCKLDSIDDLFGVMEANRSFAYVISISSFKRLFYALPAKFVVSACRDHINTAYADVFIKNPGKNMEVICLDNDKDIVKELQDTLQKADVKNINAHEAVAHGRAVLLKNESSANMWVYDSDNDCYFVFSPEDKELGTFLLAHSTNPILFMKYFRFVDTAEAYKDAKVEKDVLNALHTDAVILTAKRNSLTTPDDLNKHFCNFSEVKSAVLWHEEELTEMFCKNMYAMSESDCAKARICRRTFVDMLFEKRENPNAEEIIARGISLDKSGFKKLERHYKEYLSALKDPEVDEAYKYFVNTFSKYKNDES